MSVFATVPMKVARKCIQYLGEKVRSNIRLCKMFLTID